MNKSIIITQVATLFLIMGVGFAARKLKILNPELNKGLTELLVNITAPMTAIASFQFTFSPAMLHGAGIMFTFALAAHVFAIILGWFTFPRIPENYRKVLRFGTIFTNCGFMGYPVIGSLFGNMGIFYTSIYVASYNLFIWTYGVMIFSGRMDRQSFQKALLNPGIISVLTGMMIFLFSIKLPLPVSQAIQTIGAMTTPIAMILVGSMLAEVKPSDLFSSIPIYYGALIRLIIIPLLAIMTLKFLGFKDLLLGVAVLTVAMPVGALTVPLAEKYNGDAHFASRLVFLTTILSIFTIPMIIWLI